MSRLALVLLTTTALSLFAVPAFAADGGVGSAAGGSLHEDGDDGGKGGSASIVTDGSIPGDVHASANGGTGRDSVVEGYGGGNGGAVDIVVDAPVDGNVTGNADGGNGGRGFVTAGSGGDGGTVNIVVNAPVDGFITGSAHDGLPGVPPVGAGPGDGGTVSIVINSTVTGVEGNPIAVFANANGEGGSVTVVLGPNAVIENGGIQAKAESATLDLGMTVHSRREMRAISAYLADPATQQNGEITIDGHTYTWSDFTEVDNNLILVLLKAASAGFQPTANDYLKCAPRTVIAINKGTHIVLNAKNPNGGKFFSVGDLVGGVFVSANPLGWVASVSGAKHHQPAKVLDGAGKLISTCQL